MYFASSPAPISVCWDHNYCLLFVSTLVNSNPFSRLHGSERNTSQITMFFLCLRVSMVPSSLGMELEHLTKILGAMLVWPSDPSSPIAHIFLISELQPHCHLPATSSVTVPVVPKPVPHLACSNQSSPMSSTYNPLSPHLSCSPFHLRQSSPSIICHNSTRFVSLALSFFW